MKLERGSASVHGPQATVYGPVTFQFGSATGREPKIED